MTNLIERLRLGNGTSPDHLLLLEAADALEQPVECMCGICKLGLQRKPLTESMIKAGLAELEAIRQTEIVSDYELIKRLLEAAHGIKETEK